MYMFASTYVCWDVFHRGVRETSTRGYKMIGGMSACLAFPESRSCVFSLPHLRVQACTQVYVHPVHMSLFMYEETEREKERKDERKRDAHGLFVPCAEGGVFAASELNSRELKRAVRQT